MPGQRSDAGTSSAGGAAVGSDGGAGGGSGGVFAICSALSTIVRCQSERGGSAPAGAGSASADGVDTGFSVGSVIVFSTPPTRIVTGGAFGGSFGSSPSPPFPSMTGGFFAFFQAMSASGIK